MTTKDPNNDLSTRVSQPAQEPTLPAWKTSQYDFFGNYHELLAELIKARGPCGQEDEVAAICRRELALCCDSVTTDQIGNVVGHIKAASKTAKGSLCIMAHMDELSLIVKRVESDGSLVVLPLGGIFPANFGQGAVEILGNSSILPGALSYGSMHVSSESKGFQIRPLGANQPVSWNHVRIMTGLSKQALAENGVIAGTRVVLAKERRGVTNIGDLHAGYFMDDRALLASMLLSARSLRDSAIVPNLDLYFAATTMEEYQGAAGAVHLAKNLPDASMVALDVVPVAEEYDISLGPDPVVIYGDSGALFDRTLTGSILKAAQALNLNVRTAVLDAYRSDATVCRSSGFAPVSALIGIPTENTHGYELIHKDAIPNLAFLLKCFLADL